MRVATMFTCCCVAAAGCGRATTPSRTGARTSAIPTTASTGGLAGQSATEVLADAVRALGAAHAYAISASGSEHGLRHRTRVAVQGRALHAFIAIGRQREQLVSVTSGDYIKANLAFWKQQAMHVPTDVVAQLANRWFKVPRGSSAAVDSILASFAPARLSRCLASSITAPSLLGSVTVAGQAAVVVRTPGGAPGTASGELFVSDVPPFYPLRFVQTGVASAGVDPDCAIGPARGDDGDLSFSRWNAVRITAPAGATTLP